MAHTVLSGSHVKAPSKYRTGSNTSILSAITPEDLRQARRQAQTGRPDRLFRIMEQFLASDDEIPGAMMSLTSAISQEAIVIDRHEESDEAERQAAVLEALFDELDAVALVEELVEGHYFGFRAIEPIWDEFRHEGTGYPAPVTYELLPMSWIYADKEHRNDAYTTLFVGAEPFYRYEPGSVLLFAASKLPKRRDIDFTLFGKGYAAVLFAVYAFFSWEDWAAHNESVGTPATIGTLLQGWGDDDKKMLEQAVMNLSADARAIISEKTKLERMEGKGDGGSTFDRFLDAISKVRAKIIKSESLTDNMNKHGSNAAMLTTNGIRLDVAAGLARKITRLLNRRLVNPFLDRSFTRRLVSVRIDVKATEDLRGELAIAKGLQDMGLELSRSQLRERFGFVPPEDEEDTLPPLRRSNNPFTF